MKDSVERFRTDLLGINAGIVRPALLEAIKVDAYGEMVPISHVATVTGGSKARTLRVSPFDVSLIGKINQAIQSAGLGLNPQAAGTSLLVNIPAPDQDQRKKLALRAKSLAEQQRVAVRNVRKDARNRAKRDGTLEQIESKIEALTARMIVDVDALLQAKVDEIDWLDARWNKT
jgi:ribosome recycling factor